MLIVSMLTTACSQQKPGGASTGSAQQGANDNVVNVYFWAEYLAPDTIPTFERQTGIKVNVTFMDTLEALETKMLTGHSGFDVVIPTNMFFERQIQAGAYRPLDKSQLPNLDQLDPQITQPVAQADPGNTHGAAFTWGRFGIGYDDKKVAKALPGVPLTSWNLLFDPALAAKLAPCGIQLLDDPVGVVRSALQYLGKSPNTDDPKDLNAAEDVLRKIRPYVRNIDTAGYTDALANGDICIALAYNSDVALARKRAHEANNGVSLAFLTPAEGAILYVDLLAIPRDAPHAANAHRFINYLIDSRISARLSNATGLANANAASRPYLEPATAADTIVFPDADTRRRLTITQGPSAETTRTITRFWQEFRSGQ